MMEDKIIRALIIDDEAPARSELKFLLEQHADVCVVCEAANFPEALAVIRQCQPHLVFLDVEMPGMNGIRIAEKILETMQPLLVFATAHEEFALKAFELNAVDYLLKPFSPKRIDQCLDKVRGMLTQRAAVAVHAADETHPPKAVCRGKLAIEQGGKAQIISTNDIIAACSSEGHVDVYTVQKVYQVGLTLQELQSRLDEEIFFRSHRGCLVNIEKVKEVIPWFNGTYNLMMEGLPDVEFPVSRQQAPKLRKIFNL
ncbi:MAG TPA: LytTR family DNA-binding domain-containing protein [Selenomonadales bacterium]|nr:LytTR family DNA-binding domain-containing protein [Selenomonadales bacterium]